MQPLFAGDSVSSRETCLAVATSSERLNVVCGMCVCVCVMCMSVCGHVRLLQKLHTE